MIQRMFQTSAYIVGIGTDTELSKKPGDNQRIVLDYIQWYTYFAHADDLIQVDTYGITATDRKTLFYVNPTAAVHYAPGAAMLNLPLYPGEWFQAYVHGAAATSSLSIQVWYHIEDVTQVPTGNKAPTDCNLVGFLTGKCKPWP